MDAARRILTELDGLLSDGQAFGTGHSGALGLGFSSSLAAGNLRSVIAAYVEAYPDVRLVGVEADRCKLLQALHARTIDLAVVIGELPLNGLRRRHLWSERVMIAMPDSHPLIEQERIYWPDLRRERFVIARQDPGIDLADLVRTRLGEPGFQPEVATHEVSRENVVGLLSLGRYLRATTDAMLGRHSGRGATRGPRDVGPAVSRRVRRLLARRQRWRAAEANT